MSVSSPVGSVSAQTLGGRQVSVRSMSTQRQVLWKISARWVYEEQYMRETWYQCIKHGEHKLPPCSRDIETMSNLMTSHVTLLTWRSTWCPNSTPTITIINIIIMLLRKQDQVHFWLNTDSAWEPDLAAYLGPYYTTIPLKFLFFFCNFFLHGTDDKSISRKNKASPE